MCNEGGKIRRSFVMVEVCFESNFHGKWLLVLLFACDVWRSHRRRLRWRQRWFQSQTNCWIKHFNTKCITHLNERCNECSNSSVVLFVIVAAIYDYIPKINTILAALKSVFFFCCTLTMASIHWFSHHFSLHLPHCCHCFFHMLRATMISIMRASISSMLQ